MHKLILSFLVLSFALSACGRGGGGGGSAPSVSPAPLGGPGITTPATGTNPPVTNPATSTSGSTPAVSTPATSTSGSKPSVSSPATPVATAPATETSPASPTQTATPVATSPSTPVTTASATPAVTDPATIMQGDGSEADPFQITNVEQLASINTLLRDHPAEAYHYKLMNDIALPEVGAKCTPAAASAVLLSMIPDYCQKGWVPLGGGYGVQVGFRGTFDGRKRTVSNLTILRDGLDSLGFFGVTEDATIQDLGVRLSRLSSVNPSVAMGGLIGTSSNGRPTAVIRCFVSGGSIEGSDSDGPIGGLIGGQYVGGVTS